MNELGSGYLFVTARTANHKIINRLLLILRDYSSTEHPPLDYHNLIISRNPQDFKPGVEGSNINLTKPGDVAGDDENSWAGADVKDVEAFLAVVKEESGLYLLLDDEGVRNRTCIVAEIFIDHGEGWQSQWMKVRLPWKEAQLMWVNLHVANMGFEDFCDTKAGPDENGWFQPRPEEKCELDLEGLGDTVGTRWLAEEHAQAGARYQAEEDERRRPDVETLQREGKI